MVVGSESGAARACTADRCGALVLELTLVALLVVVLVPLSARLMLVLLVAVVAAVVLYVFVLMCACVYACVVCACVRVCVSMRPCLCALSCVRERAVCICVRASAMCKCPSLRSSVNLYFVCVCDLCWCGRLVCREVARHCIFVRPLPSSYMRAGWLSATGVRRSSNSCSAVRRWLHDACLCS